MSFKKVFSKFNCYYWTRTILDQIYEKLFEKSFGSNFCKKKMKSVRIFAAVTRQLEGNCNFNENEMKCGFCNFYSIEENAASFKWKLHLF